MTPISPAVTEATDTFHFTVALMPLVGGERPSEDPSVDPPPVTVYADDGLSGPVSLQCMVCDVNVN